MLPSPSQTLIDDVSLKRDRDNEKVANNPVPLILLIVFIAAAYCCVVQVYAEAMSNK